MNSKLKLFYFEYEDSNNQLQNGYVKSINEETARNLLYNTLLIPNTEINIEVVHGVKVND